MFVHYLDFPTLVFFAHAHGKANTARGKEGSPARPAGYRRGCAMGAQTHTAPC